MQFLKQKERRLKHADLSKKGSIDSKIIELIKFINAEDCYFTLSSCSGRIIVIENTGGQKKGCNWILVSHNDVSADDVIDAVNSHNVSATLKFEPFIMHVQCSTVEDAQKMHTAGVQSGFRNSGLTINKNGKIVVAIRSTLSLEVPLSCNGSVMVSNEYISYIVQLCNQKMKENDLRLDRFFLALKNILSKNFSMKEDIQVQSYSDIKMRFKANKQPEKKSFPIDTFYDGFDNMLNIAGD